MHCGLLLTQHRSARSTGRQASRQTGKEEGKAGEGRRRQEKAGGSRSSDAIEEGTSRRGKACVVPSDGRC